MKCRIYIPLCFYFIHSKTVKKWKDIWFTFHYASTLSHIDNYIFRCYALFTFHYASTLSKELWKSFPHASRFTFHYASTLSKLETAMRLLRINLHSTMLLLYHSAFACTLFRSQHLHSTMLLLYRGIGSGSYTDMALFTFHYASTLSGRYGIKESSATIFTFHYASTLSDGHFHSVCCGLWFTFHYASTLSAQDWDVVWDYTNLHSTMLLLYLHCWTLESRKEKNLHSTMLLLYPCSKWYMAVGCCDLHSTMLLLYPTIKFLFLPVFHIYIPLCFYFIHRP